MITLGRPFDLGRVFSLSLKKNRHLCKFTLTNIFICTYEFSIKKKYNDYEMIYNRFELKVYITQVLQYMQRITRDDYMTMYNLSGSEHIFTFNVSIALCMVLETTNVFFSFLPMHSKKITYTSVIHGRGRGFPLQKEEVW